MLKYAHIGGDNMEREVTPIKPIAYPLEKLFVAKVEGNDLIVIQINTPSGVFYRNALNLSYTDSVKHYSAGEITIIEPFKETVLQNGLSILLKDAYGNDKQNFTVGEISQIAKTIGALKKLNPNQISYIQRTSGSITNIISDLLGLNVKTNPSSTAKVMEERTIHNVVVPASKLVLFKRTLAKYLSASFLTERVAIISNYSDCQDYRIARALHIAKIKTTNELQKNIFSVRADLEGNIKIDDVDVYKRGVEQGFQKRIQF